MMRNEKGFTLIEIIAVLVILGILAAVAIPKYVDLQTEAKTKALQGALSSGASNASQEFARYTLSTGSAPTNLTALATSMNGATAGYTQVGDFTVTYDGSTDAGKSITVTVTAWPYSGTIPTASSVHQKIVKILPI